MRPEGVFGARVVNASLYSTRAAAVAAAGRTRTAAVKAAGAKRRTLFMWGLPIPECYLTSTVSPARPAEWVNCYLDGTPHGTRQGERRPARDAASVEAARRHRRRNPACRRPFARRSRL